jgi:hypothetical protein
VAAHRRWTPRPKKKKKKREWTQRAQKGKRYNSCANAILGSAAVAWSAAEHESNRNCKPCGKSGLGAAQADSCGIRVKWVKYSLIAHRTTEKRGDELGKRNNCSWLGSRRLFGITDLFRILNLASAHLLGLKILVQQEESRLVGLGRAHYGEHPLTRFIMRRLSKSKVSSPKPARTLWPCCRRVDLPSRSKCALLRSCESR